MEVAGDIQAASRVPRTRRRVIDPGAREHRGILPCGDQDVSIRQDGRCMAAARVTQATGGDPPVAGGVVYFGARLMFTIGTRTIVAPRDEYQTVGQQCRAMANTCRAHVV